MKELATENQIKALNLINDSGLVTGLQFAELMWPDSNMHHKKSYKAINSYGLSYLFKLKNRGWVNVENYTFTLSETGKQIINNQQ